MIILHNKFDEASRAFVAQAVATYGAGVTVIDWYGLSDTERTNYIKAGLSPSAFPSVIADADEKQIPRELPDGKPALDAGGKPIIDVIPARLSVIRKPENIAQAENACRALGRIATPEKLSAKLAAAVVEHERIVGEP